MSHAAARVAIVTTSYPLHRGDAAGHFVAAEARALAASGTSVLVIAPGPVPEMREESGVSVSRIAGGDAFGSPGVVARLRERPARLLGVARFVWGARRELQRRGPFDRVIAHWLFPAGWPISAAVEAPLEIVAHGSDVRFFSRSPAPFRRRLVAHWLSRDTRFRLVSSELARAFARASSRELLARTRVELPALELGEAPTRAAARDALGIDAATRLVVVVARLVPRKRVDIALGAADLVPNAEVVVVGGGPELARLKRAFPRTRFTGPLERERCLAWIAAADLLLSASREEGAPTAIREARALGVPVVSAAAGDLRTWARDDSELWVVG